MQKQFTVSNVFSRSWELITNLTVSNWIVMIGLTLLGYGFEALVKNVLNPYVDTGAGYPMSVMGLAYVLIVMASILGMFSYFGRIKYTIRLYDRVVPTWDNSMPTFNSIARFFGSMILFSFFTFFYVVPWAAVFALVGKSVSAKIIAPVLSLLGTFAFILYMALAARFFAVTVYILEDMTLSDAIKKSWEITAGHVLKLVQYVFAIVAFIILILAPAILIAVFLVKSLAFSMPMALLVLRFLALPLYALAPVYMVTTVRLLEESRA